LIADDREIIKTGLQPKIVQKPDFYLHVISRGWFIDSSAVRSGTKAKVERRIPLKETSGVCG
jgi:hypothetical protein